MSSRHNLRVEWNNRLLRWRESGLSGAAWCRKNTINYQIFTYWRKKLQGQSQEITPIQTSQHDPFIELIDSTKSRAGIEISCKGVSLYLSKDFDESSLQRCIQVLRSL